MRITAKQTIGLLLVLSPTLAAYHRAAGLLTLQPESRLWVQGTSNVRNFECKAASLDVKVETSQSGAAQRIVAGEKAIGAVTVSIPAKSLDCDNPKMNEHMLKAIKAAEYPTIDFRLASYDLARNGEGAQAVLAGTLTLGGIEKPVSITAATRADSAGVLHVTGSYELRMKDYGLKPPKLMMGAFKVNDPVKVNFDLRLKD